MKLNKQLVNKRLSNEMKKLGLKQNSYFYWSNRFDGTFKLENKEFYKIDKRSDISAYSIPELAEMLKETNRTDLIEAYLEVMDLEKYQILENDHIALMMHNIMSQPNTVAQIIIHLKENNLL